MRAEPLAVLSQAQQLATRSSLEPQTKYTRGAHQGLIECWCVVYDTVCQIKLLTYFELLD